MSVSCDRDEQEKHYSKERMRDLDHEWVKLVLIARRLGFSPEEIREFLRNGTQEKRSRVVAL